MRILFGIKSMKFMEFHGDKKGLEFLKTNIEVLEVKQKYFHVYLIPVIPLNKEYLIKSSSNQVRKASEEETTLIDRTSIPYRFPILSFSFLYLAFFVFLGFNFYGEINSFFKQKEFNKNGEAYLVSLHRDLVTAKENDLLIFYRSRVPARKSTSEEESLLIDNDLMKVGALIKERKGNTFTLSFIEDGNIDFYSENKTELNKIPDLPSLKENKVELNLDELESSIPQTSALLFSPAETVVKLRNKDGFYSLDKILELQVPVPEIMMSQGLASNGKYILLTLANMGVDAQIQEIKTLYGDLNWIEKFPINFPVCSRENGCSIQLGANFQKGKFPIQISKMKLTYGKGHWITYLIVVNNEDINLIEIYKN